MQSSSIMNKECSLNKDPRQPATCNQTKALTPLASQQNETRQEVSAIGCNVLKVGASNAWHGRGGGELCIATAQEACPGPSTTPVVTDWPPHPPVQQPVGDLVSRGPPRLY